MNRVLGGSFAVQIGLVKEGLSGQLRPQSDCFQSHSVELIFRSMIQLRLQTQNDELKSTLPLLFCKYQTLEVTIRSSED